jgi:hypothetical protein
VGESSGIDRLTDVPGFWRVRHRRKDFAQVLRSRILRSWTSALRRSRKFGTVPAQHLLAVAEAMLLAYDGGVGKLGFVGGEKRHGRRQEHEG